MREDGSSAKGVYSVKVFVHSPALQESQDRGSTKSDLL